MEHFGGNSRGSVFYPPNQSVYCIHGDAISDLNERLFHLILFVDDYQCIFRLAFSNDYPNPHPAASQWDSISIIAEHYTTEN